MTSTLLRRTSTAMLGAALAVSLSGCGNKETPAQPVSSSPASQSNTGSAQPSASASAGADGNATAATSAPVTLTIRPDMFTQQKPFTGPVANTFGADNVMAAYKYLVTFTAQDGFVQNLMLPRKALTDYKPVEFAFIAEALTPQTRTEFQTNVNKALQGDRPSIAKVLGITLFDVGGTATGNKWTLIDGPAGSVSNLRFTPANTLMATTRSGGDAMKMRFKVTVDLRVKGKDGRTYALPITRDVTYTVIPNGAQERPWIIDGWQAHTTTGTASLIQG